jgi:hypothetical protein
MLYLSHLKGSNNGLDRLLKSHFPLLFLLSVQQDSLAVLHAIPGTLAPQILFAEPRRSSSSNIESPLAGV